jgi:ABC-type sugar transport system ATPase subunit
MIVISKVSKHFGEVQALEEVNLDIATGEFISIVGPSGCGNV